MATAACGREASTDTKEDRAKFGPTPASIQPTRTMPVLIWPLPVEVGPGLVEAGPNLVQVGPRLPNIGPNLASQGSPEVVEIVPFERDWPEFDRSRRCQRIWARIWRKSTCVLRTCMGVAQERCLTNIASCRETAAFIGRCWSTSGLGRPGCRNKCDIDPRSHLRLGDVCVCPETQTTRSDAEGNCRAASHHHLHRATPRTSSGRPC